MVHKKIDSRLAHDQMIEMGVLPLEPYPGSNATWRCKCLKCEKEVQPRYSTVVTGKKNGCDFCAKKSAGETRKKRIREKNFIEACAKANVTALTEYENAFKKIDLKCNKCGNEFTMAWSPLRAGRGCPKCSRINQSAKEFAKSHPLAIQLLVDANVRPIGPYKGMAKPYLGICLTCGSKVKPKPNVLKQGQGGCYKCGKTEGGRKKKESAYSLKEALAIMATRDIEITPDEPYPGATKPWPGKCKNCGLPVATSISNARKGKGGCRVCHTLNSDSAFDFFGQGILYLISSEKFRAYKLGISGVGTARLASHKSAGWDKTLFTYEAKGFEVNYVEQFVLTWLREEMNVEEAVSNEQLPEKGGTETWPYDTIAPEIVWEKALEQFEAQAWPIPIPIQQGTAKKKARRTCTLLVNNQKCLLPYYSNNYCRKHYIAWKKYGDPLLVKRVPFTNPLCQVIENGEVCNEPSERRALNSNVGMCKTHYWRNFEYGDPTFMKRPTPKPRLGVCSIESCKKVDYSLGLCKIHYNQQRRRKKSKGNTNSES